MKFLILEDDFNRIEWFLMKIAPHRVFLAYTADDAIRALQNETFDVIFLDHDLCNDHYKYVGVPYTENFEKWCQENLDSTTGFAVARFLAQNPQVSPDAQVILHTMNTVAQQRMRKELEARNPIVCGFDYLKNKGFVING